MQNTVVWVDIPVTDIDRATRFYSALLDTDLLRDAIPGFQFAILPHADTHVSGCLCTTTDNQPSVTGPLVYLNLGLRLDAAISTVRQLGGQVLKDKHSLGLHGFRAIILDTEGNRIALHAGKED